MFVDSLKENDKGQNMFKEWKNPIDVLKKDPRRRDVSKQIVQQSREFSDKTIKYIEYFNFALYGSMFVGLGYCEDILEKNGVNGGNCKGFTQFEIFPIMFSKYH